jgi:beta-galactosidase
VRIDQIAPYKVLYLSYPVALSNAMIETLMAWVEQGGTLISEACPGYFDERGRAYPQQPSRGLAQCFGCREEKVSFGPDCWDNLSLETATGSIQGGIYRQSYETEGGTAQGWFTSGEIAIVDAHYGEGRTRLMGTMASYAYKTRPDGATRAWFADLLTWAGVPPLLKTAESGEVVGRIWAGASDHFLWAVNLGASTATTTFTISPEVGHFNRAQALRGEDPVLQQKNTITVQVEGRDAAVLRLA